MKWIILLTALALVTGCCCTNTETVAYQNVSVVPVQKIVTYTPVVTKIVTVKPVLVDYVEPADMTTAVGFYYY